MGNSLQILDRKVNSISYDEELFHASIGNNRYIFGVITPNDDMPAPEELDFFVLKTIYDSIVNLDNKIKLSFKYVLDCNPSENLENYNPFHDPEKNELEAVYYVENIVFRTSILWDLLAQLCNIYWGQDIPIDKIYYKSFFNNNSQGKKSKELAKDIYNYLIEEDEVKGNLELWKGNHKYVKNFRDQMTHRNSPNISSLSNIGMTMRPPVIYVIKRVIEDYLTASRYINLTIQEIVQNLD